MSGIGRCEHFIFKLKISLKLLCIGLLKFVCLVCKLYLFTHFAISINLFVAQNKPHKKKNNKNDFSLNQRKINHDFFFTLIRCSGEMSEKSTLFITGKKNNASYKLNNCITLSWLRTCISSKFVEILKSTDYLDLCLNANSNIHFKLRFFLFLVFN